MVFNSGKSQEGSERRGATWALLLVQARERKGCSESSVARSFLEAFHRTWTNQNVDSCRVYMRHGMGT